MGQYSEIIKPYTNIFSLDEREEIQKYLKSGNWQFGQTSHPKDIDKKFWIMSLKQEEFFNTYIFNKIQNIVSKRFLLLNVYANGQTYGQSGAWHLDSDSAEDYTFLYYANCNWKTTWGGETVFKFDDTIKYFLPKPNTALLFPATIWHYAKSPSRDFCDLRTTLAFKLRELK